MNFSYIKNPIIIFSFIFIVLISILVLIIPPLGIIISVVSGCLFLLQPLSYYLPLPSIQLFTKNVIMFIHESNIIVYLNIFYNFFFNRSYNTFRLLILSLNGFILIYSLISRYYLLHPSLSLLQLVFIVLGLSALYIRSLITFYVFIISYVQQNPQLKSLLLSDPETLDSAPAPKSFIDFSRTTHNHYKNPIPPDKWFFSRKAGIFVSVVACGAACSAAYFAKIQADYAEVQAEQARIQAEQARIQNEQMQQQNDLEALSQGLITKEDFCTYQPRYCKISNAEHLADVMRRNKAAGMPGIKSTKD